MQPTAPTRSQLPDCGACDGENVRHYVQTGGGAYPQVTPDDWTEPCDEPGCARGKLEEVACSTCSDWVSLLCGETIDSEGRCRACRESVNEDGGDR